MKKLNIKAVFVLPIVTLALLQTAAMAADSSSAAHSKPKYRKVTGNIVSASPTSIVIKGRSKKALTLAVTDKTDLLGARAVKAGDRAAVNYRSDESGNTATRIKVLSASAAKSASSPSTAPAASASKSH